MPYQTISDFIGLTIPSGTEAVFLDLDNTCYRYDPCHHQALSMTRKAIEKIVGQISDFENRYHTAQQRVKTRIPNQGASHSRILYFQALFEDLGRTDAHQHVANLESLYWGTFMDYMRPTPGLFEFLAECRRNDTTVVVVSDLTSALQCEKLVKLGIADQIDYLVTSEEAGVEKPAAAIFELAFRKAHSAAGTTVMIGDSLHRDIEGAQAIGMTAILLHHEDTTEKISL